LKTPDWLSRHLSDLFAYVLIPGIALFLPATWSLAILRRVSRWRWLMSAAARAAYDGASEFTNIADEVAWIVRWKQVELLDIRDLYMLMLGRSAAVVGEIECNVAVETAKDHVMIGMHWGPSVSILCLLERAGLKPAIPYRPPDKALLRVRPLLFVFSVVMSRYLIGTLGDRAVPVGGAGKVLRGMLDQPGCVFVVMDAPPMQGRPVLNAPVLGVNASFDAGFPATLAKRGKEYVFYAMNLHPDGTLRKQLELKGPFNTEDAQIFIDEYAAFLDSHLSSDSPHWRIWHVARQFWSGSQDSGNKLA